MLCLDASDTLKLETSMYSLSNFASLRFVKNILIVEKLLDNVDINLLRNLNSY